MDKVRRRQVGWEEDFIFLFFFVNRFVDCFFFVQFLPSSL